MRAKRYSPATDLFVYYLSRTRARSLISSFTSVEDITKKIENVVNAKTSFLYNEIRALRESNIELVKLLEKNITVTVKKAKEVTTSEKPK